MRPEHWPYLIRPMTLDDVPAVVELERIVFASPWSRYAFEHEIQHNPSACFLVLHPRPESDVRSVDRAHQPLLGYGGFWMILDEAHICTLAVRPDWRGRSLGELLLLELISQALLRSALLVTLEVRATNRVAQSLYRKYGLREVGMRKGYYADNREDALIMTVEGIQTMVYQEHLRRLRKELWARLVSHEPQQSTDAGSAKSHC